MTVGEAEDINDGCETLGTLVPSIEIVDRLVDRTVVGFTVCDVEARLENVQDQPPPVILLPHPYFVYAPHAGSNIR